MVNDRVFICFSAKDRYTIAEPIAYHLRNYGIPTWYDRDNLLVSDDRMKKNLVEGAYESPYAIVIISHNTIDSPCACEEIDIVRNTHENGTKVVFPVLYEILPDEIPDKLKWIKRLIFKEVTSTSGTREVCNHIACRITADWIQTLRIKNFSEIEHQLTDSTIQNYYQVYQQIDASNLNARVAILYCIYIALYNKLSNNGSIDSLRLVSHVFERLMNETKLNLSIDYREIRLLENSMVILVNML